MKKGKITEVEIACLRGMIAGDVAEEDMVKQLGRSASFIEKEVKKISDEAVRDQLVIKKTARGEGGIAAMTEAGSVKSDDTRGQRVPEAPVPQRNKWVHTIYDD